MHKMVSYRIACAGVLQGQCAALLHLLWARCMGVIMGLMSVAPKSALRRALGQA